MQGEGLGMGTHQPGHVGRRNGGGKAGDNGRKLQHTDAGNLHGKDGSGQRRTEESREYGAHAAHDDTLPLKLPGLEHFGQHGTQCAAHLQRGTLTSGAAAEKVGKHCGDKNQRCGDGGNGAGTLQRQNNAVGVCGTQTAEVI